MAASWPWALCSMARPLQESCARTRSKMAHGHNLAAPSWTPPSRSPQTKARLCLCPPTAPCSRSVRRVMAAMAKAPRACIRMPTARGHSSVRRWQIRTQLRRGREALSPCLRTATCWQWARLETIPSKVDLHGCTRIREARGVCWAGPCPIPPRLSTPVKGQACHSLQMVAW